MKAKQIERAWKRQGAAQKRLQDISDYIAKLVKDASENKVVVRQSRMDELLRQVELAKNYVLALGKALEKLHNLG
jgi:ATP-dependent 26S proteasome regulatory subunit